MYDIFCTAELAHPLQEIADLAGADLADFFHALGPQPASCCKSAPSSPGDAADDSPHAPAPLGAFRNALQQPVAPATLAGHDAPLFHGKASGMEGLTDEAHDPTSARLLKQPYP